MGEGCGSWETGSVGSGGRAGVGRAALWPGEGRAVGAGMDALWSEAELTCL